MAVAKAHRAVEAVSLAMSTNVSAGTTRTIRQGCATVDRQAGVPRRVALPAPHLGTGVLRPSPTYQTCGVLVFLDNNVWNDLADHPEGPLTTDLLVRVFRGQGHIAVVGTLELAIRN